MVKLYTNDEISSYIKKGIYYGLKDKKALIYFTICLIKDGVYSSNHLWKSSVEAITNVEQSLDVFYRTSIKIMMANGHNDIEDYSSIYDKICSLNI